ncbi:cysteine desulfurase [Spiroplasma clarkii]|uniref:Cysteine desulfurase n=1 Tax=Spiroplasma clarkii TaxID=2139 RepID=A0A1Y0L0K1_9MOLU|nr:aminotransferase class V-fold PLP-dependent enzyme [Spiroplasma clarkii]ARU91275.1 cysteine desulfurase [Spiroplasma clarkii]ATX70712.1 cysteine desulfurase [Spiroplasma clarkii]
MDYKKLFPYFTANPNEVYFDSAATVLKPKSVLDAEYNYNVKIAANTHNNLFDNAYLANEMVSTTRKLTAKLIGATRADEIIFTSGTTHSLNQIAFGLKKIFQPGDEIVLTKLEHSSNLLPWMVLAKELNLKLNYFDLEADGSIDLKNIKNFINAKTKLVAFANITNTMGALNLVEKITTTIKTINPQTLVVVDAAQAIIHTKTDVSAWNIDCLAFSAHKMFGPFGLGVMWAKKAVLEIMEPIFYGGGNNSAIEFDKFNLAKIPEKFEAGTLNLSAICGFQAALAFIDEINLQTLIEHGHSLKAYLRQAVKKLDQSKFEFYNLKTDEPIFLFNVKGVNAQDFGAFLNKNYHISVRVGKHCARLGKYVFKAESTIRVSFGIFNTTEDIDKLIEAMQNSDNWLDAIL